MRKIFSTVIELLILYISSNLIKDASRGRFTDKAAIAFIICVGISIIAATILESIISYLAHRIEKYTDKKISYLPIIYITTIIIFVFGFKALELYGDMPASSYTLGLISVWTALCHIIIYKILNPAPKNFDNNDFDTDNEDVI